MLSLSVSVCVCVCVVIRLVVTRWCKLINEKAEEHKKMLCLSVCLSVCVCVCVVIRLWLSPGGAS